MKFLIVQLSVFLLAIGSSCVLAQCTDPNESSDSCANACPGQDTCAAILAATAPPCGTPCVAGCRCNAGYARTTSGACILQESCCTDSNSVFGTVGGVKQCVCNTGYISNGAGVCLVAPTCTGINEVPGVVNGQAVCVCAPGFKRNNGKPAKCILCTDANAQVVTVNGKQNCACKNKFKKNAAGKCVPV